jgi:DtxR family transcriptional regulator, Mn-dependent transcriptional regulator
MDDPTRAAPISDEMLEDCLQALFRLQAQGHPPAVPDVAAFARLSEAVATATLGELARRGLVTDGGSGARALTDEGRRLAVTILRRHRLSERLFTDVLGLPWDQAHEQAMRLEHVLSAEGEARLDRLLRHPETCPHGGPIPSADGKSPAESVESLDRAPTGRRVRIEQFRDEEPGLLRHLASLGLLPQAEVTVEEVAPFGGPLLVRVGNARYAIGREIAATILVSPTSAIGPRGGRRRSRRGQV